MDWITTAQGHKRRALDKNEIDSVVGRNSANSELVTYLRMPSYRPYGMIINDLGRELMVWIDASDRIRIIDLTGDPIVKEIKKAPYEPPDSELLANLHQDIEKVFSKASNLFYVGAGVVALVAIANITKVFRPNPGSEYEQRETTPQENPERDYDRTTEIDRIRGRFRNSL